MIYKVLSRHSNSYASLLSYIFKETKTSSKQMFLHNIRGTSKKEWVREFKQNESYRKHKRSDQAYVFHEILSFSNADKEKINETILKDIVTEYIRLRGKTGVFAGAVHYDKEHIHIHFCVSSVEFRTGKAFRLSPTQLRELKTTLQEFHIQKYPELTASICEHGKGGEYLTDKEYQFKHRTGRKLLKEEIQHYVLKYFEESNSLKSFLEALREAGLHHYERKGVAMGVTYLGTKFRFSRLGISKEDIEKLHQKEKNRSIHIKKEGIER